MTSDGELMCLDKADFQAILQATVTAASQDQLEDRVLEGERAHVLIDVRLPMEARHDLIPGARNLLLNQLREQGARLEQELPTSSAPKVDAVNWEPISSPRRAWTPMCWTGDMMTLGKNNNTANGTWRPTPKAERHRPSRPRPVRWLPALLMLLATAVQGALPPTWSAACPTTHASPSARNTCSTRTAP